MRLTVFVAGALVVCAGSSFANRNGSPLVKLHEVPFTEVTISDTFWAPRRETNRKVSIPHSLDMLAKAGNIKNLELAASGAHSGFNGPVFMDSDLYKAIEAASYSLATHLDPELDRRLDDIIAKIAAAQMPDGYLDTYYQVNEPDRRWTNLRDNHELYCAGHLFEAAVAHHRATGKTSLLDVATKLADCIDRTFGSGPGKRMGYPGHPEIELALVKLWHETGEKRYFELARFFVESRGGKWFATEHGTPLDQYDGSYWQDNVPIRDHKRIVGHAVRADYLFSGVTDVMTETEDSGLLKMIDRVWRNTSERNVYITGGIGPSASNEGFTTDYDLPNLTAYQETCASVAYALWNHRLNLLYADSRYADAVETALYNGILSGVSLDGRRFFYVNPLESRGNHHRSDWFGCACCPPNVTRTLASLGGYAYAVSDTALWVNLYIQGSVSTSVGGKPVKLQVTTYYPWHGRVKIVPKLTAPTTFGLRLRVPGWCEGAWVEVNGAKVPITELERGYVALDRTWKTGDVVLLHLPLRARRVVANPQVKEDAGCVALARGPLVYCLESCDVGDPLLSLTLPLGTYVRSKFDHGLLGGVMTLVGSATVADPVDWDGKLYVSDASTRDVPFTAIPYYAWDNRSAGPMRVWLPTSPPPARIHGPEGSASVSVSFRNSNSDPSGVNDGTEPSSSHSRALALLHWWPHRGGEEWVQYDWKQPRKLSGAKVYWFDDTRSGACRPPASWHIEYRDGETWKPVTDASGYPVTKDAWCEVHFKAVTTTALRLAVTMQPEWAAGVLQWKVEAAPEDE